MVSWHPLFFIILLVFYLNPCQAMVLNSLPLLDGFGSGCIAFDESLFFTEEGGEGTNPICGEDGDSDPREYLVQLDAECHACLGTRHCLDCMAMAMRKMFTSGLCDEKLLRRLRKGQRSDGNGGVEAWGEGPSVSTILEGVILDWQKMVYETFEAALNVGYRHFDMSAMYWTESMLGEAIKVLTYNPP